MLHVRIWPGDQRRAVIIWHGITGTGADHLDLAARLAAEGHHVVAPDSLGCGRSDWATDPAGGYGLTALSHLARGLMDALGIATAAWIGASKGGGLGIVVGAASPERLDALILCDVGPGLPETFRAALARRLANPPVHADMAAFREHVARSLAREHIAATDVMIDRLSLAWSRRTGPGTLAYHYDPGLATQFAAHPEDFDLWLQWDALRCPVLLLRGTRSAVLPAPEADAMLARNPRARLLTLDGIGHLNFLDDPGQQDAILAFLAASRAR